MQAGTEPETSEAVRLIHSGDKTNLSPSLMLPPFTWNSLRYSRAVSDSNILFSCLEQSTKCFSSFWEGEKAILRPREEGYMQK